MYILLSLLRSRTLNLCTQALLLKSLVCRDFLIIINHQLVSIHSHPVFSFKLDVVMCWWYSVINIKTKSLLKRQRICSAYVANTTQAKSEDLWREELFKSIYFILFYSLSDARFFILIFFWSYCNKDLAARRLHTNKHHHQNITFFFRRPATVCLEVEESTGDKSIATERLRSAPVSQSARSWLGGGHSAPLKLKKKKNCSML